MTKQIFLSLTLLSCIHSIKAQTEDPYLWLEEVDNKKAVEFAAQKSKATMEKLTAVKEYQSIYDHALSIYNATDRIAVPGIYGNYIYNFWQDKTNVRGILRRSPKAAYMNGNPQWETLIDIDALSKKDNIQWVYKGMNGSYPDYERFLIELSKGGGDAVVVKEFDVTKKGFIENGFSLEEAKSNCSYVDPNTVAVSTDFGPGTMTSSGYARQVKLWKRGTPLKEARMIYEGKETDVDISGYMMRDGKANYLIVHRAISFFEEETFLWQDGKLVKIDIPDDSRMYTILNNQLVVGLKSDWKVDGKTYPSGLVLSMDFTSLINGKKEIGFLYMPDAFSSVTNITTTKNRLLLNVLSNVKNELYICDYQQKKWTKIKVEAPDFGTIDVKEADEFSDDYFFSFANFLMPTTLYVGDASKNTIKPLQALKASFDASRFKVDQYQAKSKDGIMVPYFVVSSKTMAYDGTNPTYLTAYGGFEYSNLPYYLGADGKCWLENGGVFVLANIRGGGEFGPKWHQDGMKEKRQNIYNDFHAVAEDLISRKITSPKHLGIGGGSNGGLLVGVAFTQRPDLYNAVFCAVPLLDMKRYNKLLAGASWMGEYGNPDIPEEWAYISKYSPYQNVKAGQKYPEVLFYTSTRDDRVHPGHARKMVAKMTDMGYPVYYYENTEGGHAGSSTNEQRARMMAVKYAYFLMKLHK